MQENGGIRSAPTLLNLLQQATAVADRTELIAPIDEPGDRAGAGPRQPDRRPRGGGPQAQGADRSGSASAARSSSSRSSCSASVLRGIFGDVGGSLDKDELGLNAPTSSERPAAEANSGVRETR